MKVERCDEFYYRISDSNLDIFNKFNADKNNVVRNNKSIKIYEGEWLKIKTNNFHTHIVKPIETLNKIAESYKTESEKIIKDNNLKSTKLFIGQILKIYKQP